MGKHEISPANLQDQPNGFNLDFSSVKDTVKSAEAIAQRLIDNPTLIAPFLRKADDVLMVASVAGNIDARDGVYKLFGRVDKYVGAYDWSDKRSKVLSLDDCKTLLLSLREENGQKKKITPQQKIVQGILRGYFNERFEKKGAGNPKGEPDWKGSVASWHRFVESTLEPEADLESLGVLLDIRTGEYPHIVNERTTAWRSIFIGLHTPNPSNERYFRVAYEADRSLAAASVLFGKADKLEKDIKFFNGLRIQAMQSELILSRGGDPRKGEGRKNYNYLLNSFRHHPERMDGYYQEEEHYDFEDFDVAIRLPLTDDIVQLAQDRRYYPDRANLILQLGSFHQREDSGNYLINVAPDLAPFFPFNIVLDRSALQEKVGKLVSPVEKRIFSNFIAKKIEERGRPSSVIPFLIDGLKGYVITSRNDVSSSDFHSLVKHLIRIRLIGETWFQQALSRNVDIFGASIDDGDIDFYFTNFIAESPLAAFLDSQIPEIYRENSLEVLNDNLGMRRRLPDMITRVPTQIGDKYFLRNHPDLPNTIDTVVVRKAEEGGLEFAIDFTSNPALYLSDQRLNLKGSVDFHFGRVNVDFSDCGLSTYQKWVLESVILHLVETSCCPTLEDLEIEIKKLTEGKKDPSLPGILVHIGGFRASGERKQWTLKADENYREVLAQLSKGAQDFNLDTKGGGRSLSIANEEHRRIHPDDDRFITYNKGREGKDSVEPATRENPERLI